MTTKSHASNFRRLAVLFVLAILSMVTLSLADSDSDTAPLPLQLPKPRFEGTPKNLPKINLDPNDPTNKGKDRAPFMAPKGITNVALKKTVTSSDANPIIGSLDQVTDGDKEAADGSYVELAEGKQWLQIDLGAQYEMYAIAIWHRHDDVRVYRDVVVQTADDPDFIKNVQTLFNNDQSNELGLGVGKDFEYIDTHYGKLIDAKKTHGRYVRLWSKGSTADPQNHYTEVEVYALPAK